MQCQAFTQSGTQCSRKAEPGSNYCWQHQKPTLADTKVDEEWVPKLDEEYYGKIPDKVTLQQLKYILANGLKAYKADAMAHGYIETNDQLEGLLDAWLEHDAIGENKFDYLLTDDISDQFFNDVMTLVNQNKDDFKVILTNEAPGGELQLMLDALQPSIMSNIIQYSGTLGNFSKTFSETNQRRLLKQWFQELHVQTPFSEVKDSEIPLLWGLYQNRIANAPPKDLLEKAIKSGLNQDYFYAKTIYVERTKLTADLDYDDLTDSVLLEQINQELKNVIVANKIRNGDILILGGEDGLVLIYDGKSLIPADVAYIGSDLPIVTKDFLINNFPTTNYFIDSLYYVVYFDTKGTQLRLLDKYKVSNYGDTIYHYITTGASAGYEIWTYTPLTADNWKGILPFDGTKAGWDLGEDFIEFIQNLIQNDEMRNIIYDKITKSQNLRMLFQSKVFKY